MNITEREEVEDARIYCEAYGDEGDEYVYKKDEQTYVIRRMMMLTPKVEDESQHHQLFRARCTINDKVFEVIFYSGSCENIIGRETVKRLQLLVNKHLNPYLLGWIKYGAGIVEVTECSRVPFSIGIYRDVVYCDVVKMDVCHLLFIRPW